MEEDKAKLRLCKGIALKYPDLDTEIWWCKTDISPIGYQEYSQAQNGYLRSTKRIPSPNEQELLELLGYVTLSSDSYHTFMDDRWTYLANLALEVARDE